MSIVRVLPVLACAALLALAGCGGGSGGSSHKSSGAPKPDCETGKALSTVPGASDWPTVKGNQAPVNALPAEYDAPYRQPLANLAWEDGIYISRDGLALYAIYMPMDVLSAVFSASPDPANFYLYERGDLIGQDFTAPYDTGGHDWIHADVVCSQRASTADPFPHWKLTDLKFQTYNRGAPQGIQNDVDPDLWDVFVFTEDASSKTRIRAVTNVPRDPNVDGPVIDLPVNISEAAYVQDNPHLEYIDGDPTKLVLFYESDKTVAGNRDMWFTTSGDSGASWADPANVTSLNTGGDDIQPHLYNDGSDWWLYYTTANAGDGKLGIFRAIQQTPGDWDSWGTPELVVGSGTAAGVGEPTLTAAGDLSFVVVYDRGAVDAYDRYDADPWFLPHK